MFAVVAMGYLEKLAKELFQDKKLEEEARALKEQVHEAIEKEGKTYTEECGMVYAYETDGFGMYNLMDDEIGRAHV